MNPLNVYSNDRLSKAVKLALSLKEITLEDLSEDDNYVFNLLKNSKSKEISKLLKELNHDVQVIESDEEYDIHQVNKFRIIDPTVVINGLKYKASERSRLVEVMNEQAIEKSKKGIFVKVL